MSTHNDNPTITKLGKYRIDSQLGRGAMGIVYKAYDEAIDRTVAIKTIREDLVDTDQFEEMKARFVCGAQATARCQHPNILMVFEYAEEEGQPFMVMEYVEGVELKDYMLDPTPPNIHDIVSIFQQLLEGLAHSHNQKVIHRDIKPANIILSKQLRVKIADFGIAKIDDRDMTRAGYIIGTPSYMSPEQIFSGKCDSRSDLYATGLILFELLSKFHSRGEATQQRINPRMEDSVTDQELSRYIPEEFVGVIKTALRKSPDHRYQNADEFSEALLKAFQNYEDVHGSINSATIIPSWQPTKFNGLREEESLTSWDVELLGKIGKRLTKILGPVAKIMVRNAAHKHDNLQDLIREIAQNIPNVQSRQEFEKEVRSYYISQTGSVSYRSTRSNTTDVGRLELDNDELEEIEQKFRLYVGPIAKRLVLKFASTASNSKELYHQLADYIPDENDRLTFLRHFLF